MLHSSTLTTRWYSYASGESESNSLSYSSSRVPVRSLTQTDDPQDPRYGRWFPSEDYPLIFLHALINNIGWDWGVPIAVGLLLKSKAIVAPEEI